MAAAGRGEASHFSGNSVTPIIRMRVYFLSASLISFLDLKTARDCLSIALTLRRLRTYDFNGDTVWCGLKLAPFSCCPSGISCWDGYTLQYYCSWRGSCFLHQSRVLTIQDGLMVIGQSMHLFSFSLGVR